MTALWSLNLAVKQHSKPEATCVWETAPHKSVTHTTMSEAPAKALGPGAFQPAGGTLPGYRPLCPTKYSWNNNAEG